MNWLEETHGTKFELVRHFAARLFDSEMFSTRGQWQTVAVSALALALPAGMVLADPWYLLPAPKTSRIPDELATMTLLMAVTGLLGILQWHSLFPSRRDYFALAGLPVRPRQVFVARFAVALMFTMGAVVAINLLPALSASRMAPQAAGSGLGCLFVLLGIAALQGVLLNALPGRWFARVSTYVQGLLTGTLFFAALLSWSIKEWKPAELARWSWAPPVWFVGLQEKLLGNADCGPLARRALVAAVSALALMVLMYLVSYKRYRRLLVEAPEERAARRLAGWRVLDLLAPGEPRKQAVIEFVGKTLARSRVHRLVLLAYYGAAIGILLNSSLGAALAGKSSGWREAVQFAVLLWPLGAVMIVLRGYRHAFSMPAELASNWVFRMAESGPEWMSAVERFVIACAIAPIHLVLGAAAFAVLPWGIALRMILLQLFVSLAAFEILFYSWQHLPFTCSYAPGRRPLVNVLSGYLATLGVLVPMLAGVIKGVSAMLEVFFIYGIFFAGFWIWMRRRRRDGWDMGRILYEEIPEALPNLGLRG